MAKRLILAVIYLLPLFVAAQSKYAPMQQQYRWMRPQKFNDTLFFEGLTGVGNVLRVDTTNWMVYRSVGTNVNAVGIGDVLGLQDSLTKKQNQIVAGTGITISGDTISVLFIPISSVTNLQDSLDNKQGTLTALAPILLYNDTLELDTIPLTLVGGLQDSLTAKQNKIYAGSGVTITNDTISVSTLTTWSRFNNYVRLQNVSTDSVGIGTATPTSKLDIVGNTKMLGQTYSSALKVNSGSFGTAVNIVSAVGDTALKMNNYSVDSISNDTLLANQSARSLVTEYAVKKYVDNKVVKQSYIVRDSVQTFDNPEYSTAYEDTVFYVIQNIVEGLYYITFNAEASQQVSDDNLNNDSLDYALFVVNLSTDGGVKTTRNVNMDIGISGANNYGGGGGDQLTTASTDMIRHATLSIHDLRYIDADTDGGKVVIQVIYRRYLGETSVMNVKGTLIAIRIE